MEELYFFIANNELAVTAVLTLMSALGLVAAGFYFLSQRESYVPKFLALFVVGFLFWQFSIWASKEAPQLDVGSVLAETEISVVESDHVKLKNGIRLSRILTRELPITTPVKVVYFEAINQTRLCFGEGFKDCRKANDHIVSAIIALSGKRKVKDIGE